MIQTYFQAEKQAGQTALAIGILACSVGGAILLKAGAPFYTGLALPLVLVGIAQVIVGATLTRRSEAQATDLEKLLESSPSEFQQTEQPRMEKVMRSFLIFKWAEIAGAVTGLAMILLNSELNFSKGLGAGLLAQSLILFVFDYFAEKRGRAYLEFVVKK